MDRPAKHHHRRAYDLPGHAHELTFSCYHRLPLLRAEWACRWLAEAINRARVEQDFALWAYVFMPEHVHLIVFPRQPVYQMQAIRSAIKGPVGRTAIRYLADHAPEWLPRITRTRGRRTERLFWQSGGGYDRNVTDPETRWAMVEHVHLNPVRRGLVERAEDWIWSSAAWYSNGSKRELQVDPIPQDWVGVVLEGRGRKTKAS